MLQLGFGRSRFRFAARPGTVGEARRAWPAPASPRRTTGWCAATSRSAAIDATVIRLDGAVETSVQLGVADVIADVVETGQHAAAGRARGVRRGDPGVRGGADHPRRRRRCPPASRSSVRRLEGVLVARSYVMMDYDIRAERVEEAVALTPGIESPTVSPLHREGWVAVRSMVPPRRRPARDGRALRPRRARHPDHGHPCLPTLSRAVRASVRPGPAAHVPAVRRPDGGLRVRRPARARDRGHLVHLPAGHPGRSSRSSSAAPCIVLGLGFLALGWGLARSRVEARRDGLTVVNGYRRPAPGVDRGGRGHDAPGQPVGGARPGRRHDLPRRSASRPPTAPGRPPGAPAPRPRRRAHPGPTATTERLTREPL